jgi:hypothetical protein
MRKHILIILKKKKIGIIYEEKQKRKYDRFQLWESKYVEDNFSYFYFYLPD